MTDSAAGLDCFYELLARLEQAVGGTRTLADCHGRLGWPARGVYFFFEPGEVRRDGSPRVTRVGTHALTATSKATLWGRLAQHRGRADGGGNHRGSIFRRHVGAALLARDGDPSGTAAATWGSGSSASREVVLAERAHETVVSAYLRSLPFLWLAVDDPPGREKPPGDHRTRLHRPAQPAGQSSRRCALARLARLPCPRHRDPHVGTVEREPRRRTLRPGVPRRSRRPRRAARRNPPLERTPVLPAMCTGRTGPPGLVRLDEATADCHLAPLGRLEGPIGREAVHDGNGVLRLALRADRSLLRPATIFRLSHLRPANHSPGYPFSEGEP